MSVVEPCATGGAQAERPAFPRSRVADGLDSRQRFLDACQCRAVDRPPVWLMRQAGRALPEYRALRERHSFLELVQTPALAAEVTLQPVRRFGFDAAILFSDILVVSEALGVPYHFRDAGGIGLEFPLRSAEDVDRLDPEAVSQRLQYVAEAITLVKDGLSRRTALLGFAGSPWTLANFMLEGGSAKDFQKAKALLFENPQLFARLMEKLTQSVIRLLQLQIDAGVDAVQIFDTLGGLLTPRQFGPASARWIKEIVQALEGQVPVIAFSKGVHGNWDDLVGTGAPVLGIDWSVSISDVSASLPKEVAVQGNLDPFLLNTTPEAVAVETTEILRTMRHRRGFIFNLGHGVPPTAKLESIEALVRTVQASGETCS